MFYFLSKYLTYINIAFTKSFLLMLQTGNTWYQHIPVTILSTFLTISIF